MTAVVTGAGSGIGRAIAHALAARGHPVALLGRRLAPLEDRVALIAQAGGRALAVPCDVTDDGAVAAAVEKAADLGAVDLVVCNARRFDAAGPLWDSDPDLWWQDVTVNLRGTYLTCRAVLTGMMARGQGLIVTLDGGGSVGGVNPGGSAYGNSKAAVVRLTQTLAAELDRAGSAVAAASFCPGFVDTAMTRDLVATGTGQQWQPLVVNAFATGSSIPAVQSAAALVALCDLPPAQLHGQSVAVTDTGQLRRRA